MLAAMIAGLGLGAWLGSKWAAREGSTLGGFGWIEIGVGFSSLALVPLFGELPVWVGGLVTRYVESFEAIQAIEFLLFFAIMLVPTTLLGMTFPIASKLYARSDALLGTEVSAVYSFNTAGGILGSLAAGFLLVPMIGTESTLVVAAALSVLVGVALTLSSRKPLALNQANLASVAAVLALIPAILLMPRWDPELMASRRLQVRALLCFEPGSGIGPQERRTSILPGRHDDDRVGQAECGKHNACRGRKGRCDRFGRHADPEDAGSPAVAAQ